MGYEFVLRLLEEGHQVTVLNRGVTPHDLPDAVHVLRADRTNPQQMQRTLLAKSFDAVVDFVMHQKAEAEMIVRLLQDQTDHYVFISTGQVYLVREGIERPYIEEEYAGRVQPPPKPNTFAHTEWLYGIHKRECEDTFREAYEDHGFPYTTLRLPMVNSKRDPFKRLYHYYLRLKDGGALLIPETPNYPLRHVYAGDVVTALMTVLHTPESIGRAYNISQDETLSIDEFLQLLAGIIGTEADIVRAKRSLLEADGFLPDCSPFSERWMSELDNERSKEELAMRYTPLEEYLSELVAYYREHKPSKPVGYNRRNAERKLAEELRGT